MVYCDIHPRQGASPPRCLAAQRRGVRPDGLRSGLPKRGKASGASGDGAGRLSECERVFRGSFSGASSAGPGGTERRERIRQLRSRIFGTGPGNVVRKTEKGGSRRGERRGAPIRAGNRDVAEKSRARGMFPGLSGAGEGGAAPGRASGRPAVKPVRGKGDAQGEREKAGKNAPTAAFPHCFPGFFAAPCARPDGLRSGLPKRGKSSALRGTGPRQGSLQRLVLFGHGRKPAFHGLF